MRDWIIHYEITGDIRVPAKSKEEAKKLFEYFEREDLAHGGDLVVRDPVPATNGEKVKYE